ncbi:polysaccharide pyruvyl transferase family protein [Alloyangia pacifica]|uniref:polysaccharide pyruvyl transferase family protein n=1 Tax=Alloyangia pacifica TaxID=311180 RepID=UPI001CFD8009|nr:polysaccharide pyruvyl transferase family protein [Alloyangia pacifica]
MERNLRKPVVAGVGWEPVDETQDLKLVLQKLGNNTGNLIFSESAFRLFPDAQRSPFNHIHKRMGSDRDCIVIAAANWLNEKADFSGLVETLEQTDVPVIVLGLGAQSGMDGKIPTLRPGTERLVRLLAERSPRISARGQFSCEVLEKYGAKNAVPTGCPSMLMAGRQAPRFRATPAWDALRPEEVLVYGTRHHFHAASGISTELYRVALQRQFDILLQSELADFYFALDRCEELEKPEEVKSHLAKVYQDSPEAVAKYLADHGRVFFDLDSWFDCCREKSFLIGTRIHGTISGILSGTPSLLIAHDSRTVELAETMNVPYVLEKGLDVRDEGTLRGLYERLEGHSFQGSYETYLKNFSDFFDKCGLDVAISSRAEEAALP